MEKPSRHYPNQVTEAKITYAITWVAYAVATPYLWGFVPTPQWVPKTVDSTKPYLYVLCFFLSYILMMKSNL